MDKAAISLQAVNTEVSYNSDVNNCQICKGMGQIHPLRDGKIQFDITVPCKCIKKQYEEQRKINLLKSCDFPENAEHMEFDNFNKYPELNNALNISKSIASKPNESMWLTLMGTNGVGKTHLAIAICKAWLNTGIASKYIYVPALFDELRSGFGNGDNDIYQRRFDYYCNIPLLLLDDLGREYGTKWVQEKLEMLIDYRLMHRLSLIITLNKSLDEISPMIASRLTRLPNSYVINIVSEDYTIRNIKHKLSK